MTAYVTLTVLRDAPEKPSLSPSASWSEGMLASRNSIASRREPTYAEGMAAFEPAPFQLVLSRLPREALVVRELRGVERISKGYRFDVVCTTTEPLPALSALLHSEAALVFRVASPARLFSGVVASVWHEGPRRDAHGAEQIVLRIVPRFALHKYRKNSRIFQNLSVPDVVAVLLADAGVKVEMRLHEYHPRRDYCTQYEETDLAFVSRILAEEGIFTFYEPPEAPLDAVDALSPEIFVGDTLVLGDTSAAYPDAATPWVVFSHAEGAHGLGTISRFVPRESVRPERGTFREYDANHPRTILSAQARIDETKMSPLEIYDHDAPFPFAAFRLTQQEPTRRLRIARRKAQICEGESTALHLAVGRRFTLDEHPLESMNQAHVVTDVHHKGWATPERDAPERYRNSFICARASVVVPPRVPRRRPCAQLLTATVTGPLGEEIHTDSQGRIKVQFHWDREGEFDERSSSWLRVMQAWAGTGWGTQFIPRIGMEVVVSFEGGDPDKPLVLGCVSNGMHLPPFGLPMSKTKSGFRTQSSPGTRGGNELSFEDKAGDERVFLFAQRNLDEVVTNDRTRVVRGNDSVTIAGSERRVVEGNRDDAVNGNATTRVNGESHVQSEGRYQAVFGAEWQTAVSGNAHLRVGQAFALRVEGERHDEVLKTERRDVHGDVLERARGSRSIVVGEPGSPRAFTLHTEGTATLRGSEELILESPKALTLKVGKTLVRLTDHGIELHGDCVVVSGKEGGLVAGDEGLALRSKKAAQIAAESLHFHTKNDAASLTMRDEIKLAGSKILLNSPDMSSDPRPEAPPAPTLISLTDEEGAPVPHQRFVIRLDDKIERSGVLDETGKAELWLSHAEATLRFPELPPRSFKKGVTWVPYVVQGGEYLDKICHRLGLAAQLIWQDNHNASLRAARPNPNQLAAGDVLWVPRDRELGEEALTIGSENRYKRDVPKVKVVLWLYRKDGSPLANEKCEVRGLNVEVESDANGKLTLELPIHVRETEVWVPTLMVALPILIGDLDPIDTPSGLKQRLKNLGYGGYYGFEDSPAEAIAKFQREEGLPTTGVADGETLSALKKAHDRSKEV